MPRRGNYSSAKAVIAAQRLAHGAALVEGIISSSASPGSKSDVGVSGRTRTADMRAGSSSSLTKARAAFVWG